ncbi:hypothetical protein DY000_02008455 [Brassica cretica]|uniref:Uncharacterized protein n=1 Tax=Brassica cretica TaxID=69181 RepID=A0ABQ7C7B5_BRACR|nr:hypothetical protein DY000_02008455 [Brassica cretica]
MVETEDWSNINLVVESQAVKIDREISKNEVVEELIVALAKDDRIAGCWTLRPPVLIFMLFVNGRGVNFVTMTGSSLTHHVALPDHGAGLDGMKTLKWREFEAKNPKPKRKRRDRFRDLAVVWTGQMGGNKTSLGKDFISSWEDENREGFEKSGQG